MRVSSGTIARQEARTQRTLLVQSATIALTEALSLWSALLALTRQTRDKGVVSIAQTAASAIQGIPCLSRSRDLALWVTTALEAQ